MCLVVSAAVPADFLEVGEYCMDVKDDINPYQPQLLSNRNLRQSGMWNFLQRKGYDPLPFFPSLLTGIWTYNMCDKHIWSLVGYQKQSKTKPNQERAALEDMGLEGRHFGGGIWGIGGRKWRCEYHCISLYTCMKLSKTKTITIKIRKGLERWFSSQKHILLLQRIQVQFSAPTAGRS